MKHRSTYCQLMWEWKALQQIPRKPLNFHKTWRIMPTLSAHPSFSSSIKRTTQAKSIDHVQPSQSQGAGRFIKYFLIFQHVNHHRRRCRVVCTSFDIALDCHSKQAAAESRFEGFLGRDDDDGNDARRCLRRCIKLQYIYIEKIFPGFSIWNIKKTFRIPDTVVLLLFLS